MLSPRAIGVIAAVIFGQFMFAMLASTALYSARRRTSRRAFVQVGIIIAFTESFIIALALSAANSARGGSESVTAGLFWYGLGGLAIVQVVIVLWWFWVAWQRRKR